MMYSKYFAWMITFVTFVAIVLSAGTFIAILRANEAIDHAHQAEYRLCLRQMINRAIIDSSQIGIEKNLPIYNCRPDLSGHPAKRLSMQQQLKFEERVQTTPRDELP